MPSRAARRAVATLPAVLLLVLWTGAGAEAAKKRKSESRTSSPEQQLAFGIDMAKRGLWNEALFRFKRASELRPGDPGILNNMAVAYEAVGDFDRALESYKKALKSAPGNQELKRNYSRFVEFYQSFRPPEAADKDGGESPRKELEGSDGSPSDPSRG